MSNDPLPLDRRAHVLHRTSQHGRVHRKGGRVVAVDVADVLRSTARSPALARDLEQQCLGDCVGMRPAPSDVGQQPLHGVRRMLRTFTMLVAQSDRRGHGPVEACAGESQTPRGRQSNPVDDEGGDLRRRQTEAGLG